jgi:hypothetical protein
VVVGVAEIPDRERPRMKLVVPQPPIATLAVAAGGRPTAIPVDEGRVTHVVSAEAVHTALASTVVVVGAPRCGKSALVGALLEAPALAAAPGAITSAYLSYRHGGTPAAFAYVPGHRGPRPLTLDDLRAGDPATPVRGGSARPPRRVDVLHPADLLRRVSLVDTPGVGGFDEVYTEIALDAVERGCGLLFVTDASATLGPTQLDFLARVERLPVPVTFVLTKIDSHPAWPAVLSANQTLVHAHTPGLATADWYAVSTLDGSDPGPPAVLSEAALGLAGVGVDALRIALTEPVPHEPAVVVAKPPAQRTAARPDRPALRAAVPVERPALRPAVPVERPAVRAAACDEDWQPVLDQAIRSLGVTVGRRLAIDLATIHVRCMQQTSSNSGCARLPHVFDRELHGLSVRVTRAVDTAATDIMRRVFAEILDREPDDAALARIRRATVRAIAAAGAGESDGVADADRILVVTVTSGIAVTAGLGAVASLSAVKPGPLEGELLAPIAVALSAGCYSLWRGGDLKESRGWLQRAIRALELRLESERAERFERIRQAIAVTAADAVDHGVLLA